MHKQIATMTVELEFSWFSSSSFIETRAFKINHKMKIEIEITILIEKKVIFSHAYCGLSCSLHGILTHMKLPDFNKWTEESVKILARQ